jgi:hypothetical protein
MITDEMRNHALRLSLEWGPEMSKPLLPKLRTIYPEIDEETVEQLDKLCREIKSFAWSQYAEAFAKSISESQAGANVAKQYPFISSENRSHLHTQGMYYAWHG